MAGQLVSTVRTLAYQGRRRLQREQLLPHARTDCNPVSGRVADQVIQRASDSLRGKLGALRVTLDKAALLQHPVDARGDLLHPLRELSGHWRGNMSGHWGRALASQYTPSRKVL